MALLTAGYWPTTFWPDSFWDPNYWEPFGGGAIVSIGRSKGLLMGVY